MSKIRVWRLGSLEHKILPTEAAINKLKSLLANIDENGGVTDIVWGPDIDCIVVDDGEDVIAERVEDFEPGERFKLVNPEETDGSNHTYLKIDNVHTQYVKPYAVDVITGQVWSFAGGEEVYAVD